MIRQASRLKMYMESPKSMRMRNGERGEEQSQEHAHKFL
jgi:hypothetical protein